MKAVIQAGGKGTRLYNVTNDMIPKPMVMLMGKPLIMWQIEKLRENGITDIFIIVGHLGDVIQEYLKDGRKYGVTITYITETKPLGSAGALYYLQPYVSLEEDIFLIYGDIFFDICIPRMLEFHDRRISELTVFAHPNAHPTDSDLLEVDTEQRVTGFLSKKESRCFWYENLVNAACFIIKASIIHEIQQAQKLDFETDVLCRKIEECRNIYAYRSTEYMKDAGTEERLRVIEHDMVSGYISKRNLKNTQKCIFMFRDGITGKRDEKADSETTADLPQGVSEAIRSINHSEYLVIAVTGQSETKQSMCYGQKEENTHKKMQTLLGKVGAYVDDTVFCNNQKPVADRLKEAAHKYNILLKDSWIIGNTESAVITGKNVGLKTIFVQSGINDTYSMEADYVAADVKEAVRTVLSS